MPRIFGKLALLLSLSLAASPALAENELSFYLGFQESPHSRVTGTDPTGVGDFDFLAAWQGRSFEAPPYYGVRYTRWTSKTLGFGVELNHAKVYADDATLTDNGFSDLEFTDGLNIITANMWRRWPGALLNGKLTPYAGGGIGVAVPHVDIQTTGGAHTFEYQLTGPAVTWAAGVKYEINESWGVFGEYKGTYSMNEVSLNGGGNLSTDIVTNALNVGISFNF